MLQIRRAVILLAVAVAVLPAASAEDAGWVNKYFRVHHRAHFKVNFSCLKNRTMCERPSESEEYLATVLWPQKIREHVTCMDWECACPIYDGKVKDGKCELPDGQVLNKGLRKEYRQLTREEREAYVDMMNALQEDGTYHQIGRIHRAAGVHSGPSFFPWHREFLKRAEFIFRLYHPHIAVPYWDSTPESHLPAPKDSVMFSRHLMGEPNEDGDVYDSPFHNFTTLDNRPTFNRQLGNQDDLQQRSHLLPPPLTRKQREHDYPADDIECEPPLHFRKAKLPLLRPYRNVDGLSNKYTDNLAEYAPRPTCRSSSAECASEYAVKAASGNQSFLFCDTTTMPDDPHCVSKVRLNGNCTGFEWSDEICYEGRCVDGECQEGKKPVEGLEKEPAVETKLPIASELPMKTAEKKTKKRPLVFEVLDVKEVTPKKISRFI
ncbi:Tyrosinase-Cu-bd domain-containing protein [Aphelenchoides fujianensis]|nr:Tyrosinase-Cu-bd domain-containing protein [Aphelenchoides fujianensis]